MQGQPKLTDRVAWVQSMIPLQMGSPRYRLIDGFSRRVMHMASSSESQRPPVTAESRWPMAIAVVVAGGLRAALPPALRIGDARWLLPVLIGLLLGALIIGDPGRIDRDLPWLQVLTASLIGLITLANFAAAIRMVIGILATKPFTQSADVLLASGGAIWLTNVIAFGLWYWALDSGGPAARARGTDKLPAFVFPEMTVPQFVAAGWYPRFVDYLHLSFTAATAFSPTDVSAIRRWAKALMVAEESVSLMVAILVIARAVNILK
jgi:hypothetical protein